MLQTVARSINVICYVLLLTLIIWLPIPLGSRPQWSTQLMEIAALTILLMWLVSQILAKSIAPSKYRSVKVVILFMALWLLYQLLQVIPLSESLARFLSPGAFTLYYPAVSDLDHAWVYSVSLDRNTSLEETVKYSAYVALFFLTFVLIDSRQRLVIFAYTIFLIGFFQSVFGIYAMFTDLYLVPKETLDGHRWVIGTFVNRNHYAAHIVMTIGVGLGLLYSQLEPSRSWSNARNIFLNLADMMLGIPGWIFACLIVLFAALFLSQSRGGVISFASAFLLLTVLTLRVKTRKEQIYKIVVTTGLVAALSAAWLGVGDLAKRFTDSMNDERWEQWRLTTHIIKDYPTFGVGSGNYRWVFPNYREGTLRTLSYEHAHQDYMELLSEQGLVGTLILSVAFFLIIKTLLRSYHAKKHQLLRGMIFGSLISMMAFMIHGLVDFNFRIPANAAYFYIIAALGLVSTTLSRKIGRPGVNGGEQ